MKHPYYTLIIIYYENILRKGEIFMSDNKDSLKNKLKGAKDKVVGETKDAYGKATNQKSKQVEGKAQKAKGHGHDALGKIQEDPDTDKHSDLEDK